MSCLFYDLSTHLGITLHQGFLQLAAEEAQELERGEICVHDNAKLTQLHFYPGAWEDVLEWVKEFYHLWAIKECPFLVCESHLLHVLPCLKKAMEEFERRAKRSKLICSNLLLYHILMNPLGYFDEYMHDMLLLVSHIFTIGLISNLYW